jgi:hypothetical protein
MIGHRCLSPTKSMPTIRRFPKVLRADATRWRDRVCADVASAAGCAAMSEHRLSIQFVNDVVDAIASHIAAGDDDLRGRQSHPMTAQLASLRLWGRPRAAAASAPA